MDEDLDELRYVCKLCDKKFPSGKSLGGHMRSHVISAAAVAVANSVESDDKYEIGNPNSSSYGLRENPKKSWRASSSSTLPSSNERICKQCGKGFQSLKALCGHMAFHSEKDRGVKGYDYSDTEENEEQDPIFVTRSQSKRYINSNDSSYSYGSCSVSEIDEFEQEEVAMCLMMLSKDSTNWAGVHSVWESSYNNSVVLEAKLSSMEMKNSRKECNLDRNGIKNLSYEEKQEIRRNLFREFGYDNSLKKRIQDDDGSYKRNKYECLNCSKTFSSFQGLGGHRPCHKKNHAFNPGKNGSESEFARNQKAKLEKKTIPKKNKGHECAICFRMFKSGQALGGHKRSHFINGSEDRIDRVAAMEHAAATYTDMTDLNLPAPEED